MPNLLQRLVGRDKTEQPALDDLNIVIAVVSDTHINSTVALCTPTVILDDGGTYEASNAQRWIWHNWAEQFWPWVGQRARAVGAKKIYGIFNGDIADSDKHDGVQVITRNTTSIQRMAEQTLRPALDVIDEPIFVRGTEAHVGKSASIEEKIAEDLGGVRDPTNDTWSWWYFTGEFAGVQVDAAHHPETSGRRPWTAKAAAARQSAITAAHYAKRGELPPHVALFGHVHYFADSGMDTMPRTFFLWPWQLTTAFGHRLGGGGPGVRPLGGMILICRDGQVSMEYQQYEPARRQRWQG